MSKRIELSVVIPTYNEAVRIEDTIIKTDSYLQNLGFTYEIIVSDANSPDKTAEIVKKLIKKYPNVQVVSAGARIGKGNNVKVGLQRAAGKYRLFMDADLATPLHHIKTAYDYLTSGSDIVIAERDLRKIHSGYREYLSLMSNYLVQFLVAPGIADTQCGFKGFSARASERCTSKQTVLGWGFDFEYLLIARRSGFRIATFTIGDWFDPKSKEEGLVGDNTLVASLKTLQELFKIKLRDIKGAYRV